MKQCPIALKPSLQKAAVQEPWTAAFIFSTKNAYCPIKLDVQTLFSFGKLLRNDSVSHNNTPVQPF